MSKYKLITEDTRKGVWITEIDLIKLIKLCHIRNNKMYLKLVEHYEFLENKKFDEELLR